MKKIIDFWKYWYITKHWWWWLMWLLWMCLLFIVLWIGCFIWSKLLEHYYPKTITEIKTTSCEYKEQDCKKWINFIRWFSRDWLYITWTNLSEKEVNYILCNMAKCEQDWQLYFNWLWCKY